LAQGVTPDTNSGEEMTLREVFDFVWLDFDDAALIHLSWRD
jgi:hypothetical protein